jgi:hypothetical protein
MSKAQTHKTRQSKLSRISPPDAKRARTIRKRIASGKRRFLAKLRDCNSVILAAERANLGRKTVYDWRNRDPKFAEAWDGALEAAREDVKVSVHEEAKRKGGDTTLKIFATKAYFPEFRDKLQIQNDPGIKRLYLAVAQVLREFVPREQLRKALIRLCQLAGVDPLRDLGFAAGANGGALTILNNTHTDADAVKQSGQVVSDMVQVSSMDSG